jgi:hypothetical protein
MSKTLVVLLVLLASAIAIVATARSRSFYAVAPVQVEIEGGEAMGSMELRLLSERATGVATRMTVYFNTPMVWQSMPVNLVGVWFYAQMCVHGPQTLGCWGECRKGAMHEYCSEIGLLGVPQA